MKGKLLLLICLLLLLSCLSHAGVSQPEQKASSSLPVHNLSTGLNYSTIQEAIDANETLDGQTILVDAGTYYENVVVNKALSLIGPNSESTVIDGNGAENVVEITANNVTLRGFTVRNGGNGIFINAVVAETFDVIAGNDILNNSQGIYLYTAYNTTITANTIANSSDKGVFLFASANNTLSQNNLIRNHIQAYRWGESGEWPNVWNNGNSSGGNFWSDYNGTDTDNDGFGDTPYILDPIDPTGNIDHYPLMSMFNSFNATSQYSVQTVCNSTISDFHFNGTAISFNAAGENDTTGFCRISIPTALIDETLTVFVNGTEVSYTLLPESDRNVSYLYFTYHQSMQQVIIMPELSSLLILPMFMMATLLAVKICKKKTPKTRELD